MLHVGVVRLVRAEEPPDRLELAVRLGGIDADGDRKRVGRLASLAARPMATSASHIARFMIEFTPASEELACLLFEVPL